MTPLDGAQAKWYFYRKKVVFTTCRFFCASPGRFAGTRIPVNVHHCREGTNFVDAIDDEVRSGVLLRLDLAAAHCAGAPG